MKSFIHAFREIFYQHEIFINTFFVNTCVKYQLSIFENILRKSYFNVCTNTYMKLWYSGYC